MENNKIKVQIDGIDYKTLLFYESGRKITLEKLHKLAEYYSTPMDDIINKKAIGRKRHLESII